MGREILKLRNLEPEQLLSLAERAGASVEAVIARLNEEGSALIEHDLRGCVAALRKSSNRLVVKSIARPLRLNIAREIRLIQPGEQWQILADDGRTFLTGEASGRMRLSLTMETARSSKKVEHEFRFLRYSVFDQEESYLVHVAATE